jgi:MtN3 and saliva related transmembrane protein
MRRELEKMERTTFPLILDTSPTAYPSFFLGLNFNLFPQLLKVLKTKSTKDISLGMISIFSGSIFLWLVYGILLKNSPIIIANFFGFIQSLIILVYKIKYK